VQQMPGRDAYLDGLLEGAFFRDDLNMTGRCDKRVTSARHKITPAGDEKVRQRPPSYPTPP
jgi:hypothetical protein